MLDECAILFLGIKKDSVKSISAFYAVFRLCNAHKLYFNIVFKLLPYVALANTDTLFLSINQILNGKGNFIDLAHDDMSSLYI